MLKKQFEIKNQIQTESEVVRVGPKHQITIPQELFQALQLEVGDFLEATLNQGGIFMAPKQLIPKKQISYLTKKEQARASVVRDKVNKIQTDILNSKGLSAQEADLAVKMELIDKDQAWWWKEHWQKGEREAEGDIKVGRVSGPFDNIEDLMEHLNQA